MTLLSSVSIRVQKQAHSTPDRLAGAVCSAACARDRRSIGSYMSEHCKAGSHSGRNRLSGTFAVRLTVICRVSCGNG